jgi:hypothetical protein
MNEATAGSIRRCGLSSLAVAVLTMAAVVTPAQAASKQKLVAQAKVTMQKENAAAEKRHQIPFKPGTKFTITCAIRYGVDILCSEHVGAEKCVKGQPWVLITDLFPILHGRLGESLNERLSPTLNYCKSS